jgi:heme/copper-type cytochrome/quinol oxidase subunit 3
MYWIAQIELRRDQYKKKAMWLLATLLIVLTFLGGSRNRMHQRSELPGAGKTVR